MTNDRIRQIISFSTFILIFWVSYANSNSFLSVMPAIFGTLVVNYIVKSLWIFPTHEDYIEDEKEKGTYSQTIRIPSSIKKEEIDKITNDINNLDSALNNKLLYLIGNKFVSGATLELRGNLNESISEYKKSENQNEINILHKLYFQYLRNNNEKEADHYLCEFEKNSGKFGKFEKSLGQTLSLAAQKSDELNSDSENKQMDALHYGQIATVEFINSYIEKNLKESFIDESLHYDSIMMPISFIDKFSLASIVVNFAKHYDKPLDIYIKNAEPSFGKLMKQIQIASNGNLDEFVLRVAITEQFISNGKGTLNLIQGCELGLFIRLLKEIGEQ